MPSPPIARTSSLVLRRDSLSPFPEPAKTSLSVENIPNAQPQVANEEAKKAGTERANRDRSRIPGLNADIKKLRNRTSDSDANMASKSGDSQSLRNMLAVEKNFGSQPNIVPKKQRAEDQLDERYRWKTIRSSQDKNIGEALRKKIENTVQRWLDTPLPTVALPNIKAEHFAFANEIPVELAKDLVDQISIEGGGLAHGIWVDKPSTLIEKYNAPSIHVIEDSIKSERFSLKPPFLMFDAGDVGEETCYLVQGEHLKTTINQERESVATHLAISHSITTEEMMKDHVLPIMKSELDMSGVEDNPVLSSILLGYGRLAGEAYENRKDAADIYNTQFHQQITTEIKKATKTYTSKGNPFIPFPSPIMFGMSDNSEVIPTMKKRFAQSAAIYRMFHDVLQAHPERFDGTEESMHRLLCAAVFATLLNP